MSSSPTYRVFLSYASEDVRTARAVAREFSAAGIPVFYAPESVGAGADYQEEITRALRFCEGVVLLLSKAAEASNEVRSEVKVARSYGKALFPFRLDDRKFPDEFADWVQYGLALQQHVPFRSPEETVASVSSRLRPVSDQAAEHGEKSGGASPGDSSRSGRTRSSVADAPVPSATGNPEGPRSSSSGTRRDQHHVAKAAPVDRVAEEGSTSRWKLSVSGLFGSEGDVLGRGNAWAVFADGRVKRTDGRGLPRRGSAVPLAPDLGGLVSCGVELPRHDLLLISRRGKALRLDPATINPQAISGSGVVGMKLGKVTAFDRTADEVIAALPVTDKSEVLLVGKAGYKVLDVSDVPRKGRGTQGVGVYSFTSADTEVRDAYASASGFEIDGKRVRSAHRPDAPVRKVLGDWERGSPGRWNFRSSRS